MSCYASQPLATMCSIFLDAPRHPGLHGGQHSMADLEILLLLYLAAALHPDYNSLMGVGDFVA